MELPTHETMTSQNTKNKVQKSDRRVERKDRRKTRKKFNFSLALTKKQWKSCYKKKKKKEEKK